MKYVIYGVNRVAKDFMYIFEDLEIVALFDENFNKSFFLNIPVYSLEVILMKRNNFDKIIICDYEKSEKEEKLKSMDLVYEKDYIYEEDFFESLNQGKCEINRENKRIVMWGTGIVANRYLASYTKYLPEFYVDTYKKDNYFRGRIVKRPSEVKDWQQLFVIIAVANDEEIQNYLLNQGLKKGIHYLNVKDIMKLPSEMLRATIFDKGCYQFKCKTMLNHIELLTGGALFCCCSTFLGSMGNVNGKTVKEVWNSVTHKIMCLSAENQTYTFCKKDMCPFFIGQEHQEKIFLEEPYKRMKEAPEVVAVGFDATCNLKCETCRRELHYACGKELEEVNNFAQITINDLLPKCDFLILAGDGEVFASQAYKKIYTSEAFKDVEYVRILSNGILFNQKNWNELFNGNKRKIMLTVSVDAASKKTYESIRKGGSFEVLKRNMEFAASLREKGELAYFRLNFVVQKRNYKEMVDFVKWGKELGVDEVFFTKILNWGLFSVEEFKEISMMEMDGITPKKELQEVLDDPIMKDSIVDLGTIRYAHKQIEQEMIENYYMWELERRVSQLFDGNRERL